MLRPKNIRSLFLSFSLSLEKDLLLF